MNVIFLDIDGVLNTATDFFEMDKYGHPINEGYQVINRGCLALLQQLIEDTEAYVVISSTWKTLYTLDELYAMFVKRGFSIPRHMILDQTPDCRRGFSDNPSDRRGIEIRKYLDNNPHVEKYVILDDLDREVTDSGFIEANFSVSVSDDAAATFIRTDEYAGFTLLQLYRARLILGLTDEARERDNRVNQLLRSFI